MALNITTPLHSLLQHRKPSTPNNLPFKVSVEGGRWTCRKKDIHPQFYEEAKVFCNGEQVMTTGGTQPEYVVDVWSGNHPFYLGSRSALLIDADQVEKFKKKYGELSSLMKIPNLKGEIILPKKKSSGAKGKGKK
ncbi:ribosomal protein L31 [Tasmannia lanceolata]|uniref:ribosomal protein L31 n=1 Tax=Tasmannia lanceolata TaxID=3420 RepID=UPI004063B802